MDDTGKNRRVCFGGRECEVVFAYLYANEEYYDIWLMDAETRKFTDACTVTDPDLSFTGQQRLVRDEFVGLLAEADLVHPTGEFIETERYGRLHTCHVPVRERVPFLEQGPTQQVVSTGNRRETIDHDTLERYLEADRRLLSSLFGRTKPAPLQPDRDELQIERDLDDDFEL